MSAERRKQNYSAMPESLKPFSNSENGLRCELELSALISHQLRTPLYTVRNALTRVLDYKPHISGDMRRLLKIMDRNIDRMVTLTERCLMLMELQNRPGAQENPTEVDLREIIDRTLHSLDDGHRSVLDRVAMVIENGVGQKALISADSFLIEQALSNVVANALQYACTPGCRNHPCIFVSLSRERCQPFYRLTVQDSGPGIPPEHRERIFQPFYRIAQLSPLHPAGSGLGLAIVRTIIRSLGGDLGVESSSAQGATFWFRIPALPPGGRPQVKEI